MTIDRLLLEQVLEALFIYEEDWVDDGEGGIAHMVNYDEKKVFDAIIAVRRALAAPEQEPVVQLGDGILWCDTCRSVQETIHHTNPNDRDIWCKGEAKWLQGPFYTTPPAAPVPEPVAWDVFNGICHHSTHGTESSAKAMAAEMQKNHDLSGSIAAFNVKPRMSNPPTAAQRQWVGLTDDDRTKLAKYWSNPSFAECAQRFIQDYGIAIEAKLREKNER